MPYSLPIKHPVLAALTSALAEYSECCDITSMLEEANLTGEEAIEFLSLFARSYPEEFVQNSLICWLSTLKEAKSKGFAPGTCSECGAPPDWRHKQGNECIMCNKPWRAVPGLYVPKDTDVAALVGKRCAYCGGGSIGAIDCPGSEHHCMYCGKKWVPFTLDGPWTPADQDAALKEGWGLFLVPGGPLHVEKADTERRFQSDEAALKWVRYNAAHYTSQSGMRSKKALMCIERSEASTLPSKPGIDPHFVETELTKAPEPTVLKLSGEMRTVPIERTTPVSVEGPDDERRLREEGFTDVRIGDHTVILDAEDLPCAPVSPPPAAPPALYMNVIKALMSQRFTDDDYRMLTALHRQPAPERALFCMVGDTSNGWFLYMGDEPEENAEMLDMCRRIFSPDFCAEIEMAMKDTDVDWLRVPGTDVDDTPEEMPVKRCKICGRVMDVPGDPTSVDRGGDCTRCMAEAGDPDARIAMHAHTGDPQWQPDPEDYKHTK